MGLAHAVAGWLKLRCASPRCAGMHSSLPTSTRLAPVEQLCDRLVPLKVPCRCSHTASGCLQAPLACAQAFGAARAALLAKFFGPPGVGVYSPSMQHTVYAMAQDLLAR